MTADKTDVAGTAFGAIAGFFKGLTLIIAGVSWSIAIDTLLLGALGALGGLLLTIIIKVLVYYLSKKKWMKNYLAFFRRNKIFKL